MSDSISRIRVATRNKDALGPMQSVKAVGDDDVAGLGVIVSQLQASVRMLKEEIDALKKRSPVLELQPIPISVSQKKGDDVSFGTAVKAVASANSPGSMLMAAKVDHKHQCVVYRKETKAELPVNLDHNIPATAYVRQEDKYYRWQGGAWKADDMSEPKWVRYLGL